MRTGGVLSRTLGSGWGPLAGSLLDSHWTLPETRSWSTSQNLHSRGARGPSTGCQRGLGLGHSQKVPEGAKAVDP